MKLIIVGNVWFSKDGGISVKVLSKNYGTYGRGADTDLFYDCRVTRGGKTRFENMEVFGPGNEFSPNRYVVAGTYKNMACVFKPGDEFTMWRGDFIKAFQVEEEENEPSVSRMMSVIEF